VHSCNTFGLRLGLPLPLAGLSVPSSEPPDARMVLGPLPLPRRNDDGPPWELVGDTDLLMGRAFRGLVRDGHHITVDPGDAPTPERAVRALLPGLLAAFLQQRGLLVLHASAVAREGAAVIVAGASGAGKSTLVARLLDAGWRLLSDDVVAIRLAPDGTPSVLPGPPHYRLCRDASLRLGLPHPEPAGRKRLVPVRNRAAQEPARLRTIYTLETHESARVDAEDLRGAARPGSLIAQLYGPSPPASRQALFRQVTVVAARARVRRLRRPGGRWTADELAQTIDREESLPA
jgi:hypothetical protein